MAKLRGEGRQIQIWVGGGGFTSNFPIVGGNSPQICNYWEEGESKKSQHI